MNKDFTEKLTVLSLEKSKNHETRMVYHKMNLERLDNCYKDFYSSNHNQKLSRKLSGEADFVNFESLEIYEKFLGE